MFEGLKKEVGMKLSDWEYAQPERPDDEEYNKAGYEILYECLKSRQKEITYCEPEEIKIEVVQIDGKYGIVSEGYQAIRDSLISMGELMETE